MKLLLSFLAGIALAHLTKPRVVSNPFKQLTLYSAVELAQIAVARAARRNA